MHFKYTIGLLLIFLVTKSHSRATEATIFYEDEDSPNSVEDDYYEDDDDEDIETNKNFDKNSTLRSSKTLDFSTPNNLINTTTIETITSSISTQISDIITTTELPKSKPNCPIFCDCENDFRLINCSKKNLDKVPNNIPEEVVILDLSYNLIEELDDNDFENITNINEIILEGNQIKLISKEVFNNLKYLTYITLDNNLLTELHSDIFVNTNQLEKVNLNNNSINLPINAAFLNQNNIKELFLTNNGITTLYDETFENLNGLKSLNLNGNIFDEKINTKAFKPLRELKELKLPDLEEDTIRELCGVIKTIDVVNFEKFDISCFQLSSGQTFNESIITVHPDIMNQVSANEDLQNTVTNLTQNQSDESLTKTNDTNNLMSSGITTVQSSTGSSLTTTLLGDDESPKLNESLSHIEEPYVSNNKIEDNNEENENTYQVAISSQTINQILLAIIIVAIVGLLIGVICRKDFCGIKTKLCRTRRPPPTDQVRPAEEIPLNKVV